MKTLTVNLLVISFLCCFNVFSKERVDQLAMYGNIDRSKNEELRKADEELISSTVKEFGSLEAASMAFVNAAFSLYQQGNNEKAMARFNQAWLINPDNPEVYWGFSAILHDRGEYCEGFKILELGLTKGALQSGYKPDLAALYAWCAMNNKLITESEKTEYNKKASEIFIEAENDDNVPKPYLYFQWARILNAQERYVEAWEIVKKYRQISNRPFNKKLLKSLTENMEEPK